MRITINDNLISQIQIDEIVEMLKVRQSRLHGLNAINFFDGLFINNMGQELLNRCKINLQTPIAKLTEKNLVVLAKTISSLKFNVSEMLTNNQVHHGGVQLSELTDGLESKKVKGLFFCGEVVNVDGLCGGFNLQWAWSSGQAVGESL